MKFLIQVFFLLVVFSFIPLLLVAQPAGGGPTGGTAPVPITGLEYLIVSGGLLGGYRYFKKRKQA